MGEVRARSRLGDEKVRAEPRESSANRWLRSSPERAVGEPVRAAMRVLSRGRTLPGTRLIRDSSEHAVDMKTRQPRCAPCPTRDGFREPRPPRRPEWRGDSGVRTFRSRQSILEASERPRQPSRSSASAFVAADGCGTGQLGAANVRLRHAFHGDHLSVRVSACDLTGLEEIDVSTELPRRGNQHLHVFGTAAWRRAIPRLHHPCTGGAQHQHRHDETSPHA